MSLIILFCLSTAFGLGVMSWLPPRLSRLKILLLSLVIGPLFYSWSVYLASLLMSFALAIFIVNLAVLLFLIFSLLANRRWRQRLTDFIGGPGLTFKPDRQTSVLFLIMGIFLLIFAWLFPQMILLPETEGWYVGLNSFGDTQFHVAAIASMVYGTNIPPQNPLYPGIFFSYPFMADFLSAILVRMGDTLREAMLYPTVIFSLAAVVWLFLFSLKITNSIKAAVFSLIFFFFNGGVGIWYFLKNNWGKSLLASLLTLRKDYTHIFEENMHFTNIISGFLEEERSLLFGLPVFLIILYLLYIERQKIFSSFIILASVLYGLLPLTHTHAFFILTAVVGWYAFMDFFSSDEKWLKVKKWTVFFLLGWLLAIPQLWLIFPQVFSTHGGFVRFHWGWMKEPNEFWAVYWFKNVGLIFPLIIIAYFSRSVSRKLKFLFIPFLITFFGANILIFQPYNWDNVKFFLFVLLTGSVLAGKLLADWWKKGMIWKISVSAVLLVYASSGFLSIWSEPKPHNLLYSTFDLETAEFIRAQTNPGAIFLAGPQHNSPVLLSGRKILLGYQGYLWVHGINYGVREKDVIKMLESNSKTDFYSLASKYGISYVIIGPTETQEMGANVSFFEKNFSKVFKNEVYTIYGV